MNPNEVSGILRRIASALDNSRSPSRELVESDLRRLVASIEKESGFLDNLVRQKDKMFGNREVSGMAGKYQELKERRDKALPLSQAIRNPKIPKIKELDLHNIILGEMVLMSKNLDGKMNSEKGQEFIRAVKQGADPVKAANNMQVNQDVTDPKIVQAIRSDREVMANELERLIRYYDKEMETLDIKRNEMKNK